MVKAKCKSELEENLSNQEVCHFINGTKREVVSFDCKSKGGYTLKYGLKYQ